jgi:hypothetical protein
LDLSETKPLYQQRPNLPDPGEMRGSVDSVPSLTGGRGNEPFSLVEPNRIDLDAAGRREVLNFVLHAFILRVITRNVEGRIRTKTLHSGP